MASAAMVTALLVTLRPALRTRMTARPPDLFELFFFCAFSLSRRGDNSGSCYVYLSRGLCSVCDSSFVYGSFNYHLSAFA